MRSIRVNGSCNLQLEREEVLKLLRCPSTPLKDIVGYRVSVFDPTGVSRMSVFFPVPTIIDIREVGGGVVEVVCSSPGKVFAGEETGTIHRVVGKMGLTIKELSYKQETALVSIIENGGTK